MRLREFHGQRVAILGFGREGAATFKALSQAVPDAHLTVWVESGVLPDTVTGRVAPFDEGLRAFDWVIRSPGISVHHPALTALDPRRVINPSSICLAERPELSVIGITGSKGKSTTSALLAHLLSACGEKVLLAGNIGSPLIEHLQANVDRVVLELSSYQLTDLQGRLDLGLITRLFPEHLDWHGGAEHYFAAKLRLFDLVGQGVVMVNGQDPTLVAACAGRRALRLVNEPPAMHRRGGVIYAAQGEGAEAVPIFDQSQWALSGEHNLDNAVLALQAALHLGHELHDLLAALTQFTPLRHRLEPVAQCARLRWINDSIATTPHATHAALSAFKNESVVLLVGGQHRPSDWQVVIDGLQGRLLAGVVSLPDSGAAIAQTLTEAGVVPASQVRHAEDMTAAVQAAADLVAPAGLVLLSPGAPSFSRYRDFEDRGERFAAAARAYCERLTA